MRRLLGPVLAVLLLSAGCGSSGSDVPESPSAAPTSSASPTPTSTPSAGGQLADDAPGTLDEAVRLLKQASSGVAAPLDADRLRTADGTSCDLTGGTVADVQVLPRCEVDTGVAAEDFCAGATTTTVGRIELRDGLVVPVCSTGTTAGGKDVPTLANGQATAITPNRMLQCVGITKGVVCVGVSVGFVMSADGYRLLA